MERQDCSNEVIRLKSVVIEKLFGTFNYRFDYENDKNTSIVIAPNGCGKTTIFKLICFTLNPTRELLQSVLAIPFDDFSCILSNGNEVGITKYVVGKHLVPYYDEYGIQGKEDKLYNFIYWEKDKSGKKREFNFYKVLQKCKNVSDSDDEKYFVYYADDPSYSKKVNGISEEYINYISKKSIKEWVEFISNDNHKRNTLNWLQVLIELRSFRNFEYPQVLFLPANRTESFLGATDYKYTGLHRRELVDLEPIASICMIVRENLLREKYEYDRLVDEAVNSLPKRYVQNDVMRLKDKEKFFEEWNKYQDEVKRFHDIGLLPSYMSDMRMNDLEKAYESKADFLQIYLSEYKKTLEPLRNIYPKLELFARIINKRNELTQKVVKFDFRKGIVFECNGKEIPLNGLSSGEKNDLITFYRLIFDMDEGSIVLVDEPEISLHISWQEEYIDRLLEICKENNSQAIVATHSPNIIKGHFDLYAKREMTYEKK